MAAKASKKKATTKKAATTKQRTAVATPQFAGLSHRRLGRLVATDILRRGFDRVGAEYTEHYSEQYSEQYTERYTEQYTDSSGLFR